MTMVRLHYGTCSHLTSSHIAVFKLVYRRDATPAAALPPAAAMSAAGLPTICSRPVRNALEGLEEGFAAFRALSSFACLRRIPRAKQRQHKVMINIARVRIHRTHGSNSTGLSSTAATNPGLPCPNSSLQVTRAEQQLTVMFKPTSCAFFDGFRNMPVGQWIFNV